MATATKLTEFDDIIQVVLKHEGGYVDDPDDRGGATNWGVTQAVYENYVGYKCDKEEIKKMTQETAEEIYFEKYWKPSRAEKLPEEIRQTYFDMVVNFGKRGAAKVLQQTCNGKNTYKIKVDGMVGTATISASKNVEPDRLRAYRVLKFASIVIKKPTQEKYWFGWFRRAIRI